MPNFNDLLSESSIYPFIEEEGEDILLSEEVIYNSASELRQYGIHILTASLLISISSTVNRIMRGSDNILSKGYILESYDSKTNAVHLIDEIDLFLLTYKRLLKPKERVLLQKYRRDLQNYVETLSPSSLQLSMFVTKVGSYMRAVSEDIMKNRQ